MLHLDGDIFALASFSDALVVPCNAGWRADGSGVMGKGLALQAAKRWPWLAQTWGAHCRRWGAATPILEVPTVEGPCGAVLLFPTKQLVAGTPHLSWTRPSSLPLIEYHLYCLNDMARNKELMLPGLSRVLVPLLGCGAGGLQSSRVIPLMERILTAPIFTLVSPSNPRKEVADGSQGNHE